MATTIGVAWFKYKESTGEQYLSLSINKELLPFAIREGKILTMWEIPEAERKSDKAPNYRIVLSEPQQNGQ